MRWERSKVVHETPKKLGPQEQSAEFAVRSGAMTRRAITLNTFYNLVHGVFLDPGLQKSMYRKALDGILFIGFLKYFPLYIEGNTKKIPVSKMVAVVVWTPL